MTAIGVCELVFEVPIGPTDFYIVGNDDGGSKESLKFLHVRLRPFSLTDLLYVPGILLSDRDEGKGKVVAIKVAFIQGAPSGITALKEGVHIGIDQDDCHSGLPPPIPVDFSHEFVYIFVRDRPAQG